MTQILENLPSGWQAHGRHRLPTTLIGGAIRRAAGVHHVITNANPSTTAALIAQIATATANEAADARLSPRIGNTPERFGAHRGFSGP